ncbi:hypothetical protein [Terrilactibacillus laevilacticus]|uniref:hypothetical protein n=1 Tax=Terrilactibacillus laevilacticus TaxID=1380157 RepID=UPI0011477780|nr:hypothetical protein [Terrilactibacillus laevilacticus]
MYIVNAVDSFCDMKLASTSGNGEKKLYLSPADSLDFAQNYLGINIANGSNFYNYNDEVRARTIGYRGYIRKSNLEDVFNRSAAEYLNTSKYRTNLSALRASNQNFLNAMNDTAYFQIDCSISQGRIYIGSQDPNWFAIPSFCIPRESQVRIINLNNSREIEFNILY